MPLEVSEAQDIQQEKKQELIQKDQGPFDDNPEIKGIYDTITKKYPNIDSNNFKQIIKNISDKIPQENIIKYLSDIVDNLIENHKDFLNLEINNVVNILISELNIISKQNISEGKQNISEETKSKIIENITNLNQIYQSIPNTFKAENNKQDFDNFKNFNLSKVQDKLIGTGISIDDYFIHRYTAHKLSQSGEVMPNKYEFIKSFNQLNKLLNIDIQIPLVNDKSINYRPLPDSLDDFQSKPEKILALSSIKEYIDSSPDILNDKDIDIPDGDIIKLYSDKIPYIISEILSKNNLDQSLIKYFDLKNYDRPTGILNKKTIKEIKDSKLLNQLQKISQAISEKLIIPGKEEILKITNKIIKQKIMTSVFRGVSEFFDITNKNIENFSSDFKLDFNQDLKLENNVVKIDGMINGSFVGLYYDLNTGNLRMDDVVCLDAENKMYKIGKKTGTLLNVPIKLPKLVDFYDDAKKFNYKYISKNSENRDEYKNKLDKDLGSVFYGKFVHKELNQYYIRRINEKNLAVQSAFSYTFANRSLATGNDKSLDTSQNIEFQKDLNPGHFEFAKIIDDSFEYYSKSDNLIKIRNLFEKFDMLINSKEVKDGNANETLINQLFKTQAMQSSANNRKSMGARDDFNYLQFYKLISKSSGDKQIIDTDILENVVNILAKGEKLTNKDNKKKFNSNFRYKYDKLLNDPEKELESKLQGV